MPDFPTLQTGPAVNEDIYQPTLRHDVPEGLAGLAEHMDSVGQVLGAMATRAADSEGRNQADADLSAGRVSPQNDMTAFGQSYNSVAKQSLNEQRKAALIGSMGQAYAANSDNPAALDTALTAAKAGFQTTPFADVNQNLDNEYALQRADLLTKAQAGLHRGMVETQGANYQTAQLTAAGTLSQLAAGASFDQAGAAKVTGAITNYAQSMAQYGPPMAFQIAGVDIPADPTRAGLLSPAEINARALAAVGEAKRTWFSSAQQSLPDAASKAKFSDDMRTRYEAGDPIFTGLDGEQSQQLLTTLDTGSQRAWNDQRVDQATHAANARQMLDGVQWGGPVDTNAMVGEAQASGDPGLVAQAQFYRDNPDLKGVQKSILYNSLHPAATNGGLTPQPLNAQGQPIGAPAPGVNPVADQVRSVAATAGAGAAESDTLVKFANAESTLSPGAGNGASQGLFQFRPKTWADMGGGDINSVHDQTVNALKLLRQDTNALTDSLGRAPTQGELYLAHQQGIGGAEALLKAPPGANAIQVLTPVYQSAGVAGQAVLNNGGGAGMTAQQFAAKWTGRFDGAPIGGVAATPAGGPAGPGASPPPGAAPGTAAYVAWTNTRAGFAGDPIKFATENNIVTPAPLIPQAAFSQDPAASASFNAALKQRYAQGTALQAGYGVPLRMLTDAEKDDYKSYLQQQPQAIVSLAQRATSVLGTSGATALLREIGEGGDVQTSIHIGQLSVMGSSVIAQAAAEGIRLKAAGAKEPPIPAGLPTSQRIDVIQASIAPAFRYAPDVLVAARNTADLAQLSDSARGITHSNNYYLQGALGGTIKNGQQFGGVAAVNGAPTVMPTWLRTDSFPVALRTIGASWARTPGAGPVYANGQAMTPGDVARLRPVMRPNGQYWLSDPRTGQLARLANGNVAEVDMEASHGFLSAHLPDAVKR